MLSKKQCAAILMSFSLLLVAGGCKKKPAPAPPPPPPPKPAPIKEEPSKAPTINLFTAEPTTIDRGQSATLRWSVSDATNVSIEPGLGTVASNGNRTVYPSSTTTYALVATGPGGDAKASATVNVNMPPPPPPPPPPTTKGFNERVDQEVSDAYFDYDKSDIREDARTALTRDADALKSILRAFPSGTVVVEGHCDERGSAEYNLGLGDRRATAAKEFLVQLGVGGDRLKTISYGKERPQCTESNETCWQKNRRAHFAAAQ